MITKTSKVGFVTYTIEHAPGENRVWIERVAPTHSEQIALPVDLLVEFVADWNATLLPSNSTAQCPVCEEPTEKLEELPPETGSPGGLMCHGCVEAAQEPECTCLRTGPGHTPGCAFHRRPLR